MSPLEKVPGQDAGAWDKLQDSVTILSALTDWALEGSIVAAGSMSSRGYGCGKLERLKTKYGIMDI